MSAREPSMEEILASIKKVIAEDKDARIAEAGVPPIVDYREDRSDEPEDEILELNEPLAPPVDLGPPLLDEDAAESSRSAFEHLTTVAAAAPAVAQANPLEELVREMLRPLLKQWLDDHLPGLIDEHVKREISRITGRPL
jgi:cell pole-organizing protein PopZ